MGKINSKIYKIIFIASCFISTAFAEGRFVDGISLIINNEPITTYEIEKYSKALNISTNRAIDLLIQKKVEDREIKRSDIRVDSYDVEQEMRKIAKQNRLSLDEFKEVLKDKGIDLDEYEEELRNKIKRERLYEKIASSKIRKATEEDLKRYYKNNPQEFSIPTKIDIIEYSSPSKEELLKLVNQPMYRSNEI
ncbi:MAG: peptidyl-prolyl cis-trans isomerase, partial [Epsilonproteobacteria bacterium]|nr:peptidyl-prolyl cis-trans isomerase [Campylobacterota bacterium]